MKTKTKKRKSLARIKKLSTLLALGLKDLRKQERAKNSEVCMGVWLDNRYPTCYACLAGSVMRWSLTARRKTTVDPYDYDRETEQRLRALACLRRGEVNAAAVCLNNDTDVSHRRVPSYHDDRDGWWAAMKQLLADLRKAGE